METTRVAHGMRRLLMGALALCCAVPLVAWAQAKDPVRIGLLVSKSGTFAQFGEEVSRAIQFAIDEANAKGDVDGRKVEVQVADDESTPEAGRRAGEKLAREGYKLLIGPIPSPISLALAPNLERWDALYVAIASKSDKFSGESCKARAFRSIHSDAMDAAMIGEWSKGFKEKTYATFAADYVFGRESSEAFTRVIKARGGDVKLSLYAPLGTKDFSPYIAQLKEANVEAIWLVEVGRDAVAFLKQAQEFGLIPKTRLIAHSVIQDAIVGVTGTALEGVAGNTAYTADIDTPRNKAFVAAWKAKFGRLPSDTEGMSYNGVQLIFDGVKKARSAKPGDIAKALQGATIDSVHGPVVMRAADNQLLLPNYIVRVRRVGEQLRPSLEQVFPASLAPPPSPLCKLSSPALAEASNAEEKK